MGDNCAYGSIRGVGDTAGTELVMHDDFGNSPLEDEDVAAINAATTVIITAIPISSHIKPNEQDLCSVDVVDSCTHRCPDMHVVGEYTSRAIWSQRE